MGKNQFSSLSGHKRKSKNRSTSNEWKLSKFPLSNGIFQESSFDSSDESNDSLTNVSSKSIEYEFKQVLNLTPSKSEDEIVDVSLDKEIIEDTFDTLIENSFEVASDDENLIINSTVYEEFIDETRGNSKVEIVSADVSGRNQSVTKKLKRQKSKEVEGRTEENAETECLASPPQKIKRKKKLKNKETDITDSRPSLKRTKLDQFQITSNDTSNLLGEVQCCFTYDGTLVVLNKNDKVYFHGLCSVVVLHGQVEVLGYTLSKNSPEVKLYSPRGSSLLYLKNVTETDNPLDKYLIKKLSNNIKLASENCAIVLCKKLEDPAIHFIEKHISQQILPKEDPEFPRMVLQPKEVNWNLLNVSESWDHIIEKMDQNTKLMICGGKGVGKTTFLRYAINRLLMKFPEVRVIDLDPGQSEFTIPGCISIVRVNEPIFGINYTHLRPAERSILSNINIGYEPDKYIESVKNLIDTSLDEVPTLINYMGYTHGIGINILSAVITCVRPNHILQICSKDYKKNYKCMLERQVVQDNAKLFLPCDDDLSYTLHRIDSMSDQNDGWTAEPRQLREMCVLAYISEMIGSDSIFTSKSPIYKVSLKDIFIVDLNGEHIHPAAVNATLVGLCKLESPTNIFQCLGWGIVKGIDLESEEIYLLTSTKIDLLDTVTHLVSGGATLPPSLYMTPEEVSGAMPYVIEGHLTSLGQITKRSRISAKSVN